MTGDHAMINLYLSRSLRLRDLIIGQGAPVATGSNSRWNLLSDIFMMRVLEAKNRWATPRSSDADLSFLKAVDRDFNYAAQYAVIRTSLAMEDKINFRVANSLLIDVKHDRMSNPVAETMARERIQGLADILRAKYGIPNHG